MIFAKALHSGKKGKRLVWLHGWGNDHRFMLPLAEFFRGDFENYVLDLPGAGSSDVPDAEWGIREYAKAVHEWLGTLGERKPTYFVGHSFGGKLSVVMASEYPEDVAGVVLVAAAGLRVRRCAALKMKIFVIKHLAIVARAVERVFGVNLRERFGGLVGSQDYRNANGVMRRILIKSVNELIYEQARKVKVPALIVYGSADVVTPPYMGKEFSQLIEGSKFVELPGFNHYNILTDARFQVQSLMEGWLTEGCGKD